MASISALGPTPYMKMRMSQSCHCRLGTPKVQGEEGEETNAWMGLITGQVV